MQNASFQAELNQQRQAFQFEKERNSYNDRRKQSLDEYSVKTADVKASELFRREVYLSQTQYDRSIHSAARTHLDERYNHKEYITYQDRNKGADKGADSDADVAAAEGQTWSGSAWIQGSIASAFLGIMTKAVNCFGGAFMPVKKKS